MEDAAKTTGLNGAEIPPFHLKVSYKALGGKGYLQDQGTYEETWISAVNYKRSLTGVNHTLDEYGTEKGIFRSGDEKKAATAMHDIYLAFLNPLPAAFFIKVSDVSEAKQEIEGVQCRCVDIRAGPVVERNGPPGYSYCFSKDNLLIRATMHAWDDTEYTLRNSIEFQGHSIPTDVAIWNQGVVVMTAHLDVLEPVKNPNEVEFQLPADAVLHDKSNITVPADFAEGLLLKRVDPVYPPIAFEARVAGVVVVHAVIGKDGHPRDVRALAGPKMLRQAAVDAVSQWLYRPYTLGGKPVAVETTIALNFSLRRR